jgi:hypothetical protein
MLAVVIQARAGDVVLEQRPSSRFTTSIAKSRKPSSGARFMTPATVIGLASIASPLLIIFWFLFRRQRAIWWFACALLVVGLGYLAATGAAQDIGVRLTPTFVGKPI